MPCPAELMSIHVNNAAEPNVEILYGNIIIVQIKEV